MSATNIPGSSLYTYTITDDFKKAFPLEAGNSKTYVLNENNEICIEEKVDDKTVKTPVVSDGLEYDKDKYDANSDVAYLAAALEKVDVAPTTTLTISGSTASATLPIGYYLVKQTKVPASTDKLHGYVASKPVLVNLISDTTVTAKDDTEKLEKKITGLNDDTEQSLDENTAKIGDKINYKVTTYIPTYGADVDKDSLKFWLYDTFSAGITYNEDVEVYISATEGDTSADKKIITGYTNDIPDASGATFGIKLDSTTVAANQGKYVTLVYSGTLNDKALVNSSEGNPNTIDLDYTNAPGSGEDHLTDKVKTYSFGLGIKKVDKATGEELDGAKFELKSKDGSVIKLVKVSDDEYRVATEKEIETGVAGLTEEIVVNSASGHNPAIKGLDEGTYILHETQAPDSYSVVADIEVTITANKNVDQTYTGDATISIKNGKTQDTDDAEGTADASNKVTVSDGRININVYVEDTKGISLPETGSKTAMYCLFAGALLVIVGGAFFGLTSRKKRS